MRGMLLALLAWPMTSLAGMADAILGEWLNEEKSARIRIEACGERYCGSIVWLETPLYPGYDHGGMPGQPKIDRNNPDPSLRQRPLLGLQILHDMRFDGDDSWSGGHIYDPKGGKSYKCRIELEDDGSLDVRGYVGFSLIGRSTTWTPVTP